MKMSIDEAIIQSRIQLTIWEKGCASILDNSPKAVETLIEIARKYQKIAKILKDDTYYEEYGNNAEKFIVSAICEVLNDRND